MWHTVGSVLVNSCGTNASNRIGTITMTEMITMGRLRRSRKASPIRLAWRFRLPSLFVPAVGAGATAEFAGSASLSLRLLP
jgi:hypothetical protein